jgi:hypothetical protein
MKIVMNIWVSSNLGYFLASCWTVSLLRMTLLYEVSENFAYELESKKTVLCKHLN